MDRGYDSSEPSDFLNYAETYARAGEAVKDAIGNSPYPEPIYYLFGQSIELSLIAEAENHSSELLPGLRIQHLHFPDHFGQQNVVDKIVHHRFFRAARDKADRRIPEQPSSLFLQVHISQSHSEKERIRAW